MADYKFLTKPLPVKDKQVTPDQIIGTIISQSLVDLCNYRIQQEEYSSRIYLSMSQWLENKGFFGGAKLFKKYSDEELTHAGLIYEFLLNLGIQPIVPKLEMPPQDFTGLEDVVYKSYAHEVEVYNQCKELATKSLSEGQLMLYPIALKLTQEQGEELGKFINIIDMFKTFGTDGATLLLIDNKMADL